MLKGLTHSNPQRITQLSSFSSMGSFVQLIVLVFTAHNLSVLSHSHHRLHPHLQRQQADIQQGKSDKPTVHNPPSIKQQTDKVGD